MGEISSINVSQIAINVGPQKTAYYLKTRFILDIETEEVKASSCVVTNWFKSDEDVKTVFVGTAKACLEYINNIVNKRGLPVEG